MTGRSAQQDRSPAGSATARLVAIDIARAAAIVGWLLARAMVSEGFTSVVG